MPQTPARSRVYRSQARRAAGWIAAASAVWAGTLAGQDGGNVEEARVPRALSAMSEVLADVADQARPIGELEFQGARPGDARELGNRLWQQARATVQDAALADDRPLYWSRLAAKRALRKRCAENGGCEPLLDAFEWASRGASDLSFRSQPDLRVMVTGFDPFLLDRNLQQSNPSGVAALWLDETVLQLNGRRAEIQALLVPVRFADFDAGRIEGLLGPLLLEDGLEALVTLSMGRNHFDLERFPGRRRSALAPDNVNALGGGTPERPLVPLLGERLLPGPEFVEFSLPVAAMLSVGGAYEVSDNRAVATLQRGDFEARSLHELANQTAVRGSGGGYLSNEISFRTVRLARAAHGDVAVGHIHLPRVTEYREAEVRAIVLQTTALIEAAIRALAEPAR